jgi:hypothetical protein
MPTHEDCYPWRRCRYRPGKWRVAAGRLCQASHQALALLPKKEKYFTTKSGVSSSALTIQVLGEQTWTPALLKTRQENLVNALSQLWRLS